MCAVAHLCRVSWIKIALSLASERPKEASMTSSTKTLALTVGLALLLALFFVADPYWTDTMIRAGGIA
jgi:hypothetical protein